MHTLSLFPHWNKQNHFFKVIGPEFREKNEPHTTVEVYEMVDKYNLRRLHKEPVMLDFIQANMLEDKQVEFTNPIIEYI